MYSTTGGEAYYAGPTTTTRQTNALSNEEMDVLMKDGPQFSLKLDRVDYLRAICTHRTKDGLHDTLVMDKVTGKFKCTTCGYVFDIIDPSTCKEDIRSAVELIQDYMQTIKVLYIDLPANAAREYFQIIAMLDKLPTLFEIAANNYLKHENSMAGWNYNNRNAGAAQLFNILNNGMTGGVYPPAGMANNQPMMYDVNGRPMVMGMDGQPQYVGGGAPTMMPGMAPGMAAPTYGPSTTGFNYNPAAAATAAPERDGLINVVYNMADQGYTVEQIVGITGKDQATINSWLAAKPAKAVATPVSDAGTATTTTSFSA